MDKHKRCRAPATLLAVGWIFVVALYIYTGQVDNSTYLVWLLTGYTGVALIVVQTCYKQKPED